MRIQVLSDGSTRSAPQLCKCCPEVLVDQLGKPLRKVSYSSPPRALKARSKNIDHRNTMPQSRDGRAKWNLRLRSSRCASVVFKICCSSCKVA